MNIKNLFWFPIIFVVINFLHSNVHAAVINKYNFSYDTVSNETLVRAEGLAKIIANDLLLNILYSSRSRNFCFSFLANFNISHKASVE